MYKDIINNFSKARILIIGDLMLDKYIIGNVDRISPEAPIQVVKVNRERYVPGGAANVANNIVSLGGKAYLAGFIGDDDAGRILVEDLQRRDIDCSGIVRCNDITTIQKIRVMAQNQQLVRMDYEKIKSGHLKEVQSVMQYEYEKAVYINIKGLQSAISDIIPDIDIVIVSDYDKGVITMETMDYLKVECAKLGKKIIVDPKPSHKDYYKDCFLITPNTKEAEGLSGMKASDEQSIENIGAAIIKDLGCNVLVTRGEHGMSLFEKGQPQFYISTKAREVYDVSGAGDTVVATMALCIASGADLKESSEIANQAAGIVVAKVGTATTSVKELTNTFEASNRKIKTLKEMLTVVEDLKAKNKRIVFTNGCFDILHAGHISLLRQARALGDILIVALNTDLSVKKIKGDSRPIIGEDERLEIISSLESVDYALLMDDDTPSELIKNLKPDIHVKGRDYDPKDLSKMPEAKIVEGYGGEVRIIETVAGKSSSNIIDRINGKQALK